MPHRLNHDETVTPALDEQLAALRALAPPTGEADLLAALYDDLDQAFVDYNATLDQAVAGEPDAIESISSGEAESAADDVERRAHDYGLTACGGQGDWPPPWERARPSVVDWACGSWAPTALGH